MIGVVKNKSREKWLKSLRSDLGTYSNPSLTPEKQELDKKIRQHIKEKGSIDWMQGPFGTTFRNMGYVEERFKDEGGIKILFYGCSIPFKGELKREVIDAVATVKRVMMASVEMLLRHKFKFFPFLFSLKSSVREFVDWMVQIYEVDLGQKDYKNLDDFSPFPRELIRAGMKLADRIPLGKYQKGTYDNREYREEVKRLFWCLGTILQSDFAYYWRAQDPLSNLDKKALNKNPRKEIERLFNLAISRENQIKEKIEILKKATLLILRIPHIRKLVINYFNELDLEKIKPDEDDYYWAGRRDSYNFGGKSYRESMVRIDRIDKEKGHVILTGS